MEDLSALEYVVVFASTLLFTLVLTPVALSIAVRRNVVDAPSEIKLQESPVPYLGGLAMAVGFTAAVLITATLRPVASGIGELAIIMGTGLALAIVGFLDDVRGLSPWPRLAAETIAGVVVAATPVGVELFSNDAVNVVVTIAWVVGVTNAMNLLDNMDGLSAGVSAIAAGAFFVIAAVNGQFLVAALSAGLAGCALGFLRHNFHPARIYMGDAGSLFLGFMLAALGIKLRFGAPQEVTFLVPVVVLGAAIFDTTLVTITRLAHRVSPLAGGRDHTSHRLVFIGLKVPVAVGLIYLGSVALGWLGLVLSRVNDRLTAYLLAGLALTMSIVLGVLLGRVPVYERSRRRRLMIVEAAAHEEPPGTIERVG